MDPLEAARNRISELEAELQQYKHAELEANARLRREGLTNGSIGVRASFYLVGFIFLASAIHEVFKGKPLESAPDLIKLGVVLCFALIAYFAFIFKYTLATEVTKQKFLLNMQDGKGS